MMGINALAAVFASFGEFDPVAQAYNKRVSLFFSLLFFTYHVLTPRMATPHRHLSM